MGKLRVDGFDFSNHQKTIKINWPDAKKAGARFLYHKATEGLDFIDSSYADRRVEAKSKGFPFGAYHYARPRIGSAHSEALAFLATAKIKTGDLVPALDLEVNEHLMTTDQLTTWVQHWFAVVFAHIGYKQGLLYTHYNLAKVPGGVHLWASRYNNANPKPIIPKPFKRYWVWQFSNGKLGNPAALAGVGHVDLDHLAVGVTVRRITLTKKPKPKPIPPDPSPTPSPSPTPAPKPVPKSTKPADPIAKIIRIATSQVGYHEGRSNGHWNNQQKYSPAVPGLEWSQGDPWCATFVSWCAMKAGLSTNYPRTATVSYAEDWFKKRNQWSEYPAIGAQVIYGNGAHTGLVYDYDATYVYTIEGNTNTNGSAEGDGVYKKKRVRRDAYVSGYGYPVIGSVVLKSADPNYPKKA